MVDSALLPDVFLFPEKISNSICFCKERLILRIALLHISGKHPEIAIDYQYPAKYVKMNPAMLSTKTEDTTTAIRPKISRNLES